jgi:hypothetical protein
MAPERSPAASFARTTPRAQPSVRPSQNRLAEQPSSSMPAVATRPIALIIIVLVIDLALAGAGAVMLMKGLATTSRSAGSSGSASPTSRSDVAVAADFVRR